MLFGRNSEQKIKGRNDIEQFLQNISTAYHVLSTTIENRKTLSNVEKCSQFLYLKEFSPIKNNLNLRPKKSYTFQINSIYNYDEYSIDFETDFIQVDIASNPRIYLFTIPKIITYTQKAYTVTPKAEDNISVIFKIKDLPEYRKASFISMDEIHFKAQFEHFFKDYNGRMIYDIEIKLPLESIIVSGVFIKVQKGLFGFEKYLYTEGAKQAIERYFIYDFARNNPDLIYTVESYDNALPEDTYEIINPEHKYIIVYDEKMSVTEYITEFLSKRQKLKIVQILNFAHLPDTILQFPPALLILNESANGESLTKHLDLIKANKCPVIITKSPQSDLHIEDFKGINVKAIVDKPVNGKTLLNHINAIYGD
jgi:hypothetical protein